MYSKKLQKGYKIIGIVDKKKNISYKKNKLNYLGDIKYFFKNYNKSQKNLEGIITVGFNFSRKKIAQEINKINPNFKWSILTHPSCIISKLSKISEGTVIVAGTIINNHSFIGKHCLINTGSLIDHDNKFNNYSSCGPGVITGGNVKVGECSHIGIGSTIKHGIQIGQNTLVGGHSFVNKNCKNNSVYYGIPIKKIKKIKKDINYF